MQTIILLYREMEVFTEEITNQLERIKKSGNFLTPFCNGENGFNSRAIYGSKANDPPPTGVGGILNSTVTRDKSA